MAPEFRAVLSSHPIRTACTRAHSHIRECAGGWKSWSRWRGCSLRFICRHEHSGEGKCCDRMFPRVTICSSPSCFLLLADLPRKRSTQCRHCRSCMHTQCRTYTAAPPSSCSTSTSSSSAPARLVTFVWLGTKSWSGMTSRARWRRRWLQLRGELSSRKLGDMPSAGNRMLRRSKQQLKAVQRHTSLLMRMVVRRLRPRQLEQVSAPTCFGEVGRSHPATRTTFHRACHFMPLTCPQDSSATSLPSALCTPPPPPSLCGCLTGPAAA
jgi:hypothetical protein